MFTHKKDTCLCGAEHQGAGLCPVCASKAMGVGRILLALIFVVGGIGFLTSFDGKATMLGSMDYAIPLFGIIPGVLMALVGVVLKLGGGAALLFGYETRHAALALIVYTVLASLMFHVGEGQLTNFLKNLAVVGGLVYVMAAGPGAWTLGRKANTPTAAPTQ